MSELSFAEEQLWLAEQAGAIAFPFFDCAPSLSVVVRLESAVNHHALQASLADIVRRHDVLRSRFVARRRRPARVCEPSVPIELETVDLRGVQEQPDLVPPAIARHVARRFDLSRGPLLRALVVALSDTEHILALTFHHIVFDRWSRRVLARELEALYESHASGRPPALGPPPAQYADYVQWQRQQVRTALGRELLDHWTARLRDLRDPMLPADGDRDRTSSTRSGTCWFTIPAGDASRLVALSRRCKTTPATLMLAILELLLHRLTGSDDVAVGVPLSDRRRPEFEHLIGLFMNVVIVRTTIADATTFLDLVDRVRRVLVEACRNQASRRTTRSSARRAASGRHRSRTT